MTILSIGYEREIKFSWLARDLHMSYCNLRQRVLPTLLSWDCVQERRIGKERRISLSARGVEVYKRLKEIGEILG